MDRGENLFAQNWVEQWKRNVRECGNTYYRVISEPTLDVARNFYCDVFSWGSSGVREPYSVWEERMFDGYPNWIEEL